MKTQLYNLEALVTGAHDVVGFHETMSGFNNQGKVTFKDIKLAGENYAVAPGEGSVNVVSHYTSSTNDWLGAKGTFNNIKLYHFNSVTQEMDSLYLTNGEFDFKFTM